MPGVRPESMRAGLRGDRVAGEDEHVAGGGLGCSAAGVRPVSASRRLGFGLGAAGGRDGVGHADDGTGATP